jgi:hypothetical protein
VICAQAKCTPKSRETRRACLTRFGTSNDERRAAPFVWLEVIFLTSEGVTAAGRGVTNRRGCERMLR